ncbi:unnamed protein product, partial [Clonostachys solani]
NMIFAACFLLFLNFPPAAAADWWDDFSNNFATDLAPLLSLFGEQVTKQFLSESIHFVDYIIFAMAPIGILTAVVSVIRTCGSPSLRAFVGRAQEGKGVAEAELCSSTSRDVCELYNNGGIARVFGRPKILEIIFDPEDPDFQKEAGIYTVRDYLKTEKSVWVKVKQSGVFAGPTTDVESGPPKKSAYVDGDVDLFAPNLSLNVGIKRQHTHVSWIVAGMGFLMQSGVMLFAGIATYYLKWEKDDKPPNSYSCPMTFAGTILLGIGTFYCAFLVGESTDEQFFMKRDLPSPKSKQRPIMIWVQPGGQVLGDQTFDPFCYSDDGKPLEQYVTSWKKPSVESPFRVWAAIGVTMLGFVLQFTGLRGIHSAVSLAQIAVVLAMSMIRSLLRTQRLKLEDNKLGGFPDQVTGYELDWLALHIGEADIQQDLNPPSRHSRSSSPSWKFDNNMELESVLGLWAWSLMSDRAVEKKDGLSSLIRSRALEVPARRIVSTAEEIEILEAWLPDNVFNLKEHTFHSWATQSEPGSLWEEFDSKYRPFRGQLEGDIIQPSVVRFFGWNIHVSSNLQDRYRDSGTLKMFSARTSGTLVSSCAHEIFASFLASVLDKASEREDARIEVDDLDFRLRSPLVDKVVKAFTDSQLGSTEEAMFCVLPPIISRL